MDDIRLKDQGFEDLYMGSGFFEIKGLTGASSMRVPAPLELERDIRNLYTKCMEQAQRRQKEEFSLNYDDVQYRVTIYKDLDDEKVFVCRRSMAEVRPLDKIYLPVHISKVLDNPTLKGLILVGGEMGGGKTTTAMSIVVDRLNRFGGLAIVIEDPPEAKLNGVHGKGRCIQIEADRNNGGYAEPLIKALRSGADIILIGEIRDSNTAVEVIRASQNGHLIISTIHGGSITQAISRLATLSGLPAEEVYPNIADGLSLVIFQKKMQLAVAHGASSRVSIRGLDLLSSDAMEAKIKIRENKIHGLDSIVESQTKKATWSNAGLSLS